MKSIKIIHAHNHGHKNVGDDAMANNVYRKLKTITSNIWTITTYSPPDGASHKTDVRSISGTINNYRNIIIKVVLILIARLKLRPLYVAYAYLTCESIYLIALMNRKFGIPLIAFGGVKKTIKALASTENYVRSGSGSLNDIWFWSSMYPQYTEARIVSLNGGKVYFIGQGIGPITTRYRRKILKEFTEVCTQITLRDPKKSEQLLHDVGATSNNWEAVGDDAIDHPKRSVTESVTRVIKGKEFILCQFRPTDYEKWLDNSYWSSLARNLEKVIEQNPMVSLIAISFSTGRVNDLDAARKLNSMSKKKLLTIIEYDFTPAEAKSLFGMALATIGQSYHFGVFSLSENTPFIGLYNNDYYKDKLGGLLDWYDSMNMAVRSDDFERLPQIIAEIKERRSILTESFKQQNKILINKVNSVFQKII